MIITNTGKRAFFPALLVITFLSGCVAYSEPPEMVTDDILRSAKTTVERFQANPDLNKFSNFLKQAKGVVILPRVIKAGFFAGGEGGNGVLLIRRADGSWGQPAFYTLAAASFGLQFGVQDTAIILVLRNQGALDSILKYQGKIGADTGATVGVYGVGMEASTTTNLGADIVAFASSNVGAYLGASLEGAALVVRRDLNEAVYGKGATPASILNSGTLSSGSQTLRQTLAKAAR